MREDARRLERVSGSRRRRFAPHMPCDNRRSYLRTLQASEAVVQARHAVQSTELHFIGCHCTGWLWGLRWLTPRSSGYSHSTLANRRINGAQVALRLSGSCSLIEKSK